jgi:hypothetical protein
MGKTERSNGAFGKSDIEGKAAMVAASKRGHERVSNGREHMSQRGQRTSFNRTREAGHLDEIQGVVANTLKLARKMGILALLRCELARS